jgi:hypothetical protein
VHLLQAVAFLNRASPGTVTTIEAVAYSDTSRRGLPPQDGDASTATLAVTTVAESVARVRMVSWTESLLAGELLVSGKPTLGQTFNCTYALQDFMSRSAISAEGLVIKPMFIEATAARTLINREQSCSTDALNATMGIGSCTVQVPQSHFPSEAGKVVRKQVTLEVEVWASQILLWFCL